MASVRCIVSLSNVRFLSKNYPRRIAYSISKTFDIGFGFERTLCNSRIFSTYENKTILQRSQSLVSLQGLHHGLKLSKVLSPEISAFRSFSSEKSQISEKSEENVEKSGAESEANLTVFQRFKKTYKEHGKILVIVHCMTSIVWFGSFYMAAVSGVDIVPLMEQLGFSETIIKPFRAGGLGYVALAYLMYKLATPARYTVTLGGTNFAIKYLRKTGKMDHIPKGENLRSLYKDGKSELKERHETFQMRRKHGADKIRKQRIFRRKDS